MAKAPTLAASATSTVGDAASVAIPRSTRLAASPLPFKMLATKSPCMIGCRFGFQPDRTDWKSILRCASNNVRRHPEETMMSPRFRFPAVLVVFLLLITSRGLAGDRDKDRPRLV